jgi:hypothetical protein
MRCPTIHCRGSTGAELRKVWKSIGSGGNSWSGRRDLNSGPPAPKAGALPGCATPRHEVLYSF